MSDADPVLLDPAAADPEVGTLRAAMEAREWTGVRAVLDAASPTGRSLLIGVAAADTDLAEFLEWVLRGDPADSAAAAMLGSGTGGKVLGVIGPVIWIPVTLFLIGFAALLAVALTRTRRTPRASSCSSSSC